MVIALAMGLVLIAVPMYLWRGSQRPVASTESATGVASSPPPPSDLRPLDGGLLRSVLPPIDELEAAAERASVKLSRFRTLRCVKSGPGKTPPRRCDHLEDLEAALAKAIRDHASLGPATPKGATVSFVMDADFRSQRLKIYRGKSSTVPEGETAELFRRIKEAVRPPSWNDEERDHYRYVVNVKATYPPSRTF